MARLPVPGNDTNVWGEVLNEFLLVEHNNDGTHKNTKTFRYTQTFTIGGYVNVAIGDIDYINPIFVAISGSQTLRLVGARHRINNGTSATVSLQRNGSNMSGFTGITVTTTTAATSPTGVALADGDQLALVVTAISGSPQNLSMSLIFELTA